MTKQDGGPAFPRDTEFDDEGEIQLVVPGMSLRDWFAGQALPPLIAILDVHDSSRGQPPDSAWAEMVTQAARLAYEQANAMLAEGAKTDGR